MSSDLIVNLPFASRPDLSRLITENIPQSIRALRAAPGFLKIDCLLNARPRSLTNLHRATRGASPKSCSIKRNKRYVAPRTRAMFARTCCLPCNCNHGFFSLQISSVSAVARTLRRVSPAKDPDDRLQGAATDLRDSLTMSARRRLAGH